MKYQRLRGVPALECLPERRGDEVGAVLGGYPVCHNLAGKKIEDHADLKIILVDFNTGHVTDPSAVRRVRLKLPLKDILPLRQLFSFLMIPFRVECDVLQSHFTHQLCGIFRRNANSLFG